MSSPHHDLTILSVRSAYEHMEATVKRALERIERRSQLKSPEVFNAIKERRKIAKCLHLDEHLQSIYQALLENPTLEIKPTDDLIPASLSACVQTVEGSDKRLQFLLNDRVYQIQYRELGSGTMDFDGVVFGSAELCLQADDQRVFALHLDLSGSDQKVDASQITTFIPGKWIYDLIHAYQTLYISKKLKGIKLQHSPESISLLKEQFGL